MPVQTIIVCSDLTILLLYQKKKYEIDIDRLEISILISKFNGVIPIRCSWVIFRMCLLFMCVVSFLLLLLILVHWIVNVDCLHFLFGKRFDKFTHGNQLKTHEIYNIIVSFSLCTEKKTHIHTRCKHFYGHSWGILYQTSFCGFIHTFFSLSLSFCLSLHFLNSFSVNFSLLLFI